MSSTPAPSVPRWEAAPSRNGRVTRLLRRRVSDIPPCRTGLSSSAPTNPAHSIHLFDLRREASAQLPSTSVTRDSSRERRPQLSPIGSSGPRRPWLPPKGLPPRAPLLLRGSSTDDGLTGTEDGALEVPFVVHAPDVTDTPLAETPSPVTATITTFEMPPHDSEPQSFPTEAPDSAASQSAEWTAVVDSTRSGATDNAAEAQLRSSVDTGSSAESSSSSMVPNASDESSLPLESSDAVTSNAGGSLLLESSSAVTANTDNTVLIESSSNVTPNADETMLIESSSNVTVNSDDGVAASVAYAVETAVAAALIDKKINEASEQRPESRPKRDGATGAQAQPRNSAAQEPEGDTPGSWSTRNVGDTPDTWSTRTSAFFRPRSTDTVEPSQPGSLGAASEDRAQSGNGADPDDVTRGQESSSEEDRLPPNGPLTPVQRRRLKLLKAAKRRALAQRLASKSALRRALGIPEPGETRRARMFRERSAQVRQQMGEAVRSAQQSALAELVSVAFFILLPLSLGAVVYTLVGNAIGKLEPVVAAPPPPETHTWWRQATEAWDSWMRSGQAAGAAGVLSGFAGVGLAAKTAAPAAALVASSASGMDTLWRSFGGASLVALYWKTLVFGKTFRAVEWDLVHSEGPEGPMHSVTIRVPSLSAVKAKIAAENGISDPSAIKQLALWIPGSGDFVEPLEMAKDLTLVPEMGFIVWTVTPRTDTPFPSRAHSRAKAKPSGEAVSDAVRCAAMVEAVVSAWDVGAVGPALILHREEWSPAVNGTPVGTRLHGGGRGFGDLSPMTEHSVGQELAPMTEHMEGGKLAPMTEHARGRLLAPMTEQERDALINLAAKEDRGLKILFEAFGPGEQFAYHSLYFIRSIKR